MKAAVVGETALEIREVPQPKPKPTEVLVKVMQDAPPESAP